MKIEQRWWSKDKRWSIDSSRLGGSSPQLVLVFASPETLRDGDRLAELRAFYPTATLAGCSSAGEILDTRVYDDTLVATAIHFEKTPIAVVERDIASAGESHAVGQALAGALAPEALRHVLVLSDGIGVNGSELVAGLRAGLPPETPISGGLAGDGARFQTTYVLSDRGAASGRVLAIGFYGADIRIGCGSLGGWDPFGPDRVITRARDNVLYELDGQSALALYKTYLGEHAAGLPASGLLFPLEIRAPGAEAGVVRTILAVDENAQSMTFAGDMPEGARARLMKANFDRLIEGAVAAAETSLGDAATPPELAILISCVGRKLILKQRIEEEVEGAREVLGEGAALTGFYSYGEISPFRDGGRCELHNQTMTITTFAET